MKRIVDTPLGKFCVGGTAGSQCAPGYPDGWEISVAIIHQTGRGIQVGWGFDDEMPLRPWPMWQCENTTPKGHPRFVLTWCGFFVGVNYKGKP